jgi:predicted nucleotidyltransferase
MDKNKIKLKGLNSEETFRLLPDNLIFLSYRGSIAHGMYVPNSDPNSIDDRDIMGVYINPIEHYLGFGRKDVSEIWIKEYDAVHYELRKLVSLLLKSNPNVMSLLWVEDKHVLYEHPTWTKLKDNRELFVSKKAYHSFTGYAYSQLKRMEQFSNKGYMGEKRKRLVEKFGYDTKNAAHLIRLLKMGIEFMVEGRLYVERTKDASYLLDIKKGKYSLDYIKKEAKRLFELSEKSYIESNLPSEPDREHIEKLLTSLIIDYLKQLEMP